VACRFAPSITESAKKAGFNFGEKRKKDMPNQINVVISEDAKGNLQLTPPSPTICIGDQVSWTNTVEYDCLVDGFVLTSPLFLSTPYRVNAGKTAPPAAIAQQLTFSYTCSKVVARVATSNDPAPANGIIIVDSTKPNDLLFERQEKVRRGKSKRQEDPELVCANGSSHR
jgi:hypothetical protein